MNLHNWVCVCVWGGLCELILMVHLVKFCTFLHPSAKNKKQNKKKSKEIFFLASIDCNQAVPSGTARSGSTQVEWAFKSQLDVKFSRTFTTFYVAQYMAIVVYDDITFLLQLKVLNLNKWFIQIQLKRLGGYIDYRIESHEFSYYLNSSTDVKKRLKFIWDCNAGKPTGWCAEVSIVRAWAF